jgi:DNA (cytosine-5)-methyltransferase 1
MNGDYSVISTFAGGGGSSLGYKMAGFKELLAIELDGNAVETFKLNFDCPIWQKDILEVKGKDILEFCNIKKGELDILDGSPPCQGFSMVGNRNVNDNRNDLFKEYVRLIKELSPKVFVMENVPGMIKGKMKGRFIEIMNNFKSLDYNVKCKLLNAKYYNVPQSRERLIFIGIRKDLKKFPIFPNPNNKIITVKKAFEKVKNKTYSKSIIGYCQEKEYPKIKQGKTGINGKYFQTSRLDWRKPSRTILKSTTWAGFSGLIHPDENRDITIDECKRLTSFPDKRDSGNNKKRNFRQILS